jgi:hypothetical protein
MKRKLLKAGFDFNRFRPSDFKQMRDAAEDARRPEFFSIPEVKNQHLLDTIGELSRPKPYFSSDTHIRQLTRANWEGVHPGIVKFAVSFYREARKFGIPVYIHTVYRSPDKQAELVSGGFSQLKLGPHTRGCAVDLVHGEYLWDDMPTVGWAVWKLIADRVIQANPDLPTIQWGGDWDGDGLAVPEDPDESFWDPAHFQLKDWRQFRVYQSLYPVHRSPLIWHSRGYS